MRADRLIALIMLLQTRGRMTARALADALEVSPRTIFRDVEALSAAGIPVYAERGPEGGICLVENYRTDLTGLSGEEAGALMLLDAPGPLDGLEIGRSLRSALLKLRAAMRNRPIVAELSTHILLDGEGWTARPAGAGLLDRLYRSLAAGRKVRLGYRLWSGLPVDLPVSPLGLVNRAGEWHLVYAVQGGRVASRAVSAVETVEALDEAAERPPGFDLRSGWETLCVRAAAAEERFCARARVDPALLPVLRSRLGARLREGGALEDGRVEIEARFGWLEQARAFFLAFGAAAEVTAPAELRWAVRDLAARLVERYGGDSFTP